MKNLSITTAILAALFFVGVAVNFAGAAAQNGPGAGDCVNFVDDNGDGINDACPNEGVAPQDGTGEQKGAKNGGSKDGNGAAANGDCVNFVDEDGDGVNDSCPNGGIPPQDGTGVQKRGRFAKFVDEDGDGINDNVVAGNGDRISKLRSRGLRRNSTVEASGDTTRTRDCDGTCDGTGTKVNRRSSIRGRR